MRSAHRRLRARLAAYHAGEISYAELDASIQGWINHVRHADSWGLRRHVLETLVDPPRRTPPRGRGTSATTWLKKFEAALTRRLSGIRAQKMGTNTPHENRCR